MTPPADMTTRLVQITEAEARSILRWVTGPEDAGLQPASDEIALSAKMRTVLASFEDSRMLSPEETATRHSARRGDDRLSALEQRVTVLELRARVTRDENSRRAMEVLGSFARSPLNDGSLAMAIETISTTTNIEKSVLVRALGDLQQAGFVELIDATSTFPGNSGLVKRLWWRITVDGLSELSRYGNGGSP